MVNRNSLAYQAGRVVGRIVLIGLGYFHTYRRLSIFK